MGVETVPILSSTRPPANVSYSCKVASLPWDPGRATERGSGIARGGGILRCKQIETEKAPIDFVSVHTPAVKDGGFVNDRTLI